MKIAIILLNYNNSGDTVTCIHQLEKFVPFADIFLVDNNSTDGSKELFTKKYADVERIHLIINKFNSGYAGGNNVGIRAAMKSGSDYICILNNDVVIKNDFLSCLIDILMNNTKVGLIGPCISDTDGIITTSGNNFNFYSTSFGQPINKGKAVDKIKKELLYCDYLLGACLVFRGKDIKKVGFIPEMYFLNFEETEWCFNFIRNDYLVACNTDSVLYHKGSKSIKKISGMQLYFLRRNRVIFESRNASLIQKIIFYSKLLPLAVIQTFRHSNFEAVKAYCDGITGRNKFDFLKK
ncbi:glycosyltransferase family 2 protein [Liquorilactobacillus oeni]|nr:glycosyltransferase family 2 protein [Liquorilactobacillus oeni]